MRRNDVGWIVTAKLPPTSPFKAHYFPRQVHYKQEALLLAQTVRDAGGTAEVHPAKDYHEQARIADSVT